MYSREKVFLAVSSDGGAQPSRRGKARWSRHCAAFRISHYPGILWSACSRAATGDLVVFYSATLFQDLSQFYISIGCCRARHVAHRRLFLYTHTQNATQRNSHTMTTSAAAAQSSGSNSSSISLSTRFSRATNTPSPSVHNRLLDAPSSVCSFFHFPTLSSFFSCLLFLSSPMTPRILPASLLSPRRPPCRLHFALYPSTTPYSFPTFRLAVHPRSRDTPSSVSSLRSFVTTQRAHLIRIIRAISVFSTRPLRP